MSAGTARRPEPPGIQPAREIGDASGNRTRRLLARPIRTFDRPLATAHAVARGFGASKERRYSGCSTESSILRAKLAIANQAGKFRRSVLRSAAPLMVSGPAAMNLPPIARVRRRFVQPEVDD